MESNKEKGWRMEELVESKSFADLNDKEARFVLQELGSEQAYNTLRKISAALVADKADLSPDPHSLNVLKGHLRQRSHVAWYRQVFEFTVPAYAVVLLLTMITLGYLLSNMSRDPGRALTITKIELDTVYVATPADTVFVDRIVVKYLRSTKDEVPDYSFVKHNLSEEGESAEGVNMKEKEELERFLVSGS